MSPVFKIGVGEGAFLTSAITSLVYDFIAGAVSTLGALAISGHGDDWLRRRFDFNAKLSNWLLSLSPNQALQRNAYVCHGPCMRTLRASHRRG
jgi:hypothetical protein